MVFPPQNTRQEQDLLNFARQAAFEKGQWPSIKRLYKDLESLLLKDPLVKPYVISALGILLSRIDQCQYQDLQTPYPTYATLRYMKRRGRRLFRQLYAQEDPNLESLLKVFIEKNRGRKKVDLAHEWMLSDLLLGNSRRAYQKGNGQGKFWVNEQAFVLHHTEEKYSDIWLKDLNFLKAILEEDYPEAILDFVIKIFIRQEIQIQSLPEASLSRFFKAASPFLRKFATEIAYQSYSYQGLKPELYAGMYFNSSPDRLLKIQTIDDKRPQKNPSWYQDFASSLDQMLMHALKRGNKSRRVVQSLALLQKRYPRFIPQDNLLEIAPALFSASDKNLLNLAFQAAKRAPKEEALAWLIALDPHGEALDLPKIDRLASILIEKFNPRFINRSLLETFIFNDSFAATDFAWRLSTKMTYSYSLYYVWNRLTHYPSNRRVKEIYLKHSLQSLAGSEAFVRYYGKNKYSVNYIPNAVLQFILAEGRENVQKALRRILKEAFLNQPLNQLSRISFLIKERDSILEEALQTLANQEVFRYSWQVNSAFSTIQENDWAREALFKIISKVSLNAQAAHNIMVSGVDRGSFSLQLFQFINTLGEASRQAFVKALADDVSIILNHSVLLPTSLREEALRKLSLESQLMIVQEASEESWAELKSFIHTGWTDRSHSEGLWKLIIDKISQSENQRLRQRLLEDPHFRDLFLAEKDLRILEISEPEYETLLREWVENQSDLFFMDSSALFQACIHKMPSLRAWAFQRSQDLGLSLSFALQLMESDLPEAFNFARAYFESQIDPPTEAQVLLALCDSPNSKVRQYGEGLLKKKLNDHHLSPTLGAQLSEHGDARIQHLLAQGIKDFKGEEDFIQNFDRHLLKTFNRSRSAKELVKTRISRDLSLDNATLLQLARGLNRNDAEWAIEQLSKKVLAGEEIEGFELD